MGGWDSHFNTFVMIQFMRLLFKCHLSHTLLLSKS